MSHGHVHEEAEHASHHADDPFNRQVALSMVVIAALLAGVKVLAHRTHNDTLIHQIKAGVYQGKANIAQSEANAATTATANLWAFFQSKKMREVLAAQEAKRLELLLPKDKPADGKLTDRDQRLKALVKNLQEEKVPDADKVAGNLVDRAEVRYAALLKDGYAPRAAKGIVDEEMTAARYREEGNAIRVRALAEEAKARKASEKAQHYVEEAEGHKEKSGKFHVQADWFDLGELAVELGIVLASVAILSRDRRFWIGGIAVALIGAVIVAIGLGR
jgi:hypothetical protein